MLVYATADQLETWMGETPEPAPAKLTAMLREASGLVGTACQCDIYDTLPNGKPSDDDLSEAKQEAIERAPKETGYLRNTAATAAEGLEAAVGFDGPYAIRQHEELGYHHQDGEAKYLENAVIATREVVGQILAESIRRQLG